MSNELTRQLILEKAAKYHPRVATYMTLLEEREDAENRKDVAAQVKLSREIETVKTEVAALEHEYRATMATACEKARAETNDDARVEKLLDAFELCARTHILAIESFLDSAGADIAIQHKHALVADLGAMQPDRRPALGKFLDHPYDGVRASAAAHLFFHKLLQARALCVLDDINNHDSSDSLAVQMIARFAVTPLEWRDPPGGEDVAERNDIG